MPFVGRLKSPYQPAFSQGFQQVSSILQNLALLKMQQNFRAQEAETARTHQETMQTQRLKTAESVAGAKLRAKAPTSRDVKEGDEVVKQQWNPATQAWVEVSRAPRYKPGITINMPSGAERERLASANASLDALENIRRLHNDAFTGPVTGKVGKIKDVFGLNPEKQSQFYAATAAFKNQIIKEITGAQMSEAEASRIMKQVPDVDDAPSVWRSKWKESVKNIQMLQKRRLEILRETGLVAPKPRPTVQDDPLGLF